MKKTFTFVLVTITVVLFTVVAFMSHTRTAGPLFAMNVEALARNNGSNEIWGWDVTNECLHCDVEQIYACGGHPKTGSGEHIIGYSKQEFQYLSSSTVSIEFGGEVGLTNVGMNGGGNCNKVFLTIMCCQLANIGFCDFNNQNPICDQYFYDQVIVL